MSTDYIIFLVVAALGIGGGLLVHREAKKYRARRLLHDKRLGRAQESLKAIALHLGVTESTAAQIAINRLYLNLFHGGEEYDFPTAEQIKEMDAKFGNVNIVKTQTLAELLEGKAI